MLLSQNKIEIRFGQNLEGLNTEKKKEISKFLVKVWLLFEMS